MELNLDVITLLNLSEATSERNGFGYIPELIAFGSLAMMADSPLHTYLIQQGMEHNEIVEQVISLYERHFPEEKERFKEDEYDEDDNDSFVIFKLSTDDSYDELVMTSELYDIMEFADEIAKNSNVTDTSFYGITNYHMFAAFTEKMADIYLEFIISCLGNDAVLPNTALDKVNNIYMAPTVKKFSIPKNLSGFLTLMNDKYSADEEYCKILGREKETDMLTKILAKATKRNAILVGHPGVGKTAIVEKYVWNIVKGNCHGRFKNSKVLSLDVTSIIAGTQYRGTAEERFQGLIKFLENHPECILFIDEIHTILGAGASKTGELDLANALKPILARGTTQVIGATTFEEYEKYFSKDGALKRRFEKITVNEPKNCELYNMIKNQILNLENFHNTKITKDLVDFVILNASCFNFETKNPDRTLDLLDRVMATAELKGKTEVSKEDILENFTIRKEQFERMPEREKRATAYHEAGHYIVQRFSKELQYYHTLAISIIPAEDYLGINVYEEDEYATPSMNRDFFIQRIGTLLGGRRAEKLYTNELSSGADSDLTKATRIAKDMVTRYALDEDFTENRVFLQESKNPMYTDRIIEKISAEIDKFLEKGKLHADSILKQHKRELDILADELMKKGILSENELEKIFSDFEKPQIVSETELMKNI